MHPDSRVVKQSARQMLRGRFAPAIAVCAIGFAAALMSSLSADIVELVGQYALLSFGSREILLAVLVSAVLLFAYLGFVPLFVGILRWFWLLSFGETPAVSEVFYYYETRSRYGSCLSLITRLFLRAVGIGIPAFLPFGYFYYVIATFNNANSFLVLRDGYRFGLYAVCLVTALLGLLIEAIFMSRYFLAPILFFGNESLGVSAVIRLSHQLVKGYRTYFFYFLLTFAGWFLLCLFVVPILFALPYFTAGFILFSRQTLFAATHENKTKIQENEKN